jgi:hypothetical protein
MQTFRPLLGEIVISKMTTIGCGLRLAEQSAWPLADQRPAAR